MTIHELLAAAGLTANDEIPIWDAEATGEPTKKITAQQLAAAVVALANLVTGVKGDKESNYRQGNVNLTPANIGAVAKSGDTMTGKLVVECPNDAYVGARNTDTDTPVYLDSNKEGKHGIWSNGYYTGSDFVNSGEFIISRNADGKVTVADHYNENEVNALGVLYTDVNIGNVTVNGSGYLDIASKIPSGITPIAALILDFGTTTGAVNVIANGRYIIGTPNATATSVKIRYYYRGQ
jgi:hypothetical protein